jgi:hypothetical protein
MLLACDRSVNMHKHSLMHLRVYDVIANPVGIYLLSQKPKSPALTQFREGELKFEVVCTLVGSAPLSLRETHVGEVSVNFCG